MGNSAVSFFRYLRLGLIGILIGAGGTTPAQTPAIPSLSANDVSWLFPAPVLAKDFDNLISMRDLTTQNPQDPTKRDPVWPDVAFQRFLEIAASSATQVGGTQGPIGLPAEARSIDAWFIAGIRIDAGAPGLSNDIREQFGQSPEIRLIVQPVVRSSDGTPKVLDFAAHLIFDFVVANKDEPAQPGCSSRPKPDLVAFKSIVADLAALRTKLVSGQLGANKVTTADVPLGVHPGLKDATTAIGVRQAMKSFLETHISGQRLDAMAIVGVPAGASSPWIFLSILRIPPGAVSTLPNGLIVPVAGPTLDGQQLAQMLSPGGGIPVSPMPHTNNLNPITCKNAAIPNANLPIAARSGLSTAELFANPQPSPERIKEVLDLIADPTRSHFFNTDCVSCHTETRRRMDLMQIKDFSGIDPAVLPPAIYTVRNFGWSPPIDGLRAVATNRTAAETAAVVTFINSQLLTH